MIKRLTEKYKLELNFIRFKYTVYIHTCRQQKRKIKKQCKATVYEGGLHSNQFLLKKLKYRTFQRETSEIHAIDIKYLRNLEVKKRDVLQIKLGTRNLNVTVRIGWETLIMVLPCENNEQNMDSEKDTGIKMWSVMYGKVCLQILHIGTNKCVMLT